MYKRKHNSSQVKVNDRGSDESTTDNRTIRADRTNVSINTVAISNSIRMQKR